MADNNESFPEIENLESLVRRIEPENSNLILIIQASFIKFMQEKFPDGKGGFRYEPLKDEDAKELSRNIMNSLREYFAKDVMEKKDGASNEKQLELLDAVIQTYTGLTEYSLSSSLVGEKLTFDTFSRLVLNQASNTYQR
ncbi:MAG: hypothetical protein QW757_01120 [Candidatus Woesearchaeota archaeon]